VDGCDAVFAAVSINCCCILVFNKSNGCRHIQFTKPETAPATKWAVKFPLVLFGAAIDNFRRAQIGRKKNPPIKIALGRSGQVSARAEKFFQQFEYLFASLLSNHFLRPIQQQYC
jgi:hypothetical protein